MEDIEASSLHQNTKAKTHKGKQHLDEFLPKLIEGPKKAIFINTKNSSEIMRMAMNELVSNKIITLIVVFNEERILKEIESKE